MYAMEGDDLLRCEGDGGEVGFDEGGVDGAGGGVEEGFERAGAMRDAAGGCEFDFGGRVFERESFGGAELFEGLRAVEDTDVVGCAAGALPEFEGELGVGRRVVG